MRPPRRRPQPLAGEELYEYGLRSLGRRMRTVAELRRLLAARAPAGPEGGAAVEAVLNRLRGQGYLDDAGFAASFTRLRQENEKHGRRRVERDLRARGVGGEAAAEAVAQAYEQVDEEALARRHLERRRVRPPQDEKQAARVMRLLVRAGFSPAVIYRILRSSGPAGAVPDEAAIEEAGEDHAGEDGEGRGPDAG